MLPDAPKAPVSVAAAKKPSKAKKRFFAFGSRQDKKGLVPLSSSAPDLDESSLTLPDSSYNIGVRKTPKERLTLIEIADKLQRNVEVRNRTYHLKKYPQCFVGSEAVDYLVESNLAPSREDAVRIGNDIMAAVGIFEHVCQEHDLQDGYFFYRFIDPQPVTTMMTGYQRYSSAGSSETNGGGGGKSGVKMDKYGFLVDDKDSAVAATGTTEKINIFQLRAEAKKWEGILGRVTANGKKKSNSVDDTYLTNPSKVKYHARRGLPDGMRRKAWTALTGVDLIIKAHPGIYDELVDKATVEYEKLHNHDSAHFSLNSGVEEKIGPVMETIDRDLNRTFPKHCLFQSRNEDRDNAGHCSTAAESVCNLENVDSVEEEDGEDYDTQSTGLDESLEVESKRRMFDEANANLKDLRSSINSEQSLDGSAEENDQESVNSVDIFDREEDDDEVNTKGGNSQSRNALSGEALGIGQGQDSLRRILRAYSMYDTDVGYCQGMNFIAAMFLTFLSEEEAFWLLVVVMNEEPYKLREMFGEDMAGTHEVLYIAEKLLAQFLPNLARQMEEEMIHVSMFVTPWLLTVYTSTFPFDLVVRVWDSFLVEGWKVVYRVMLSLLEHASKDLAELQFEEILNYFRDFPSTVDGQTIMAGSFRIPLKSKHIQNHVIQWRRHAASKEQTKDSMASTFARKNSGGSKNSGGDIRQNSGGNTRRSNGGASVSSNTSNSISLKPFPSILPTKPPMRRRATSREIEIENLSEKLLPIVGSYKFAVMIHNILSPEECSELIDRAEEEGFEEDAIIFNPKTKSRHRDCTRYLLDDHVLAEEWYVRIVSALKDTPFETKLKNAPWIQKSSGMIPHAVGLNEHFRLLKYKQGQFFQAHTDESFVRRTYDGMGVGDMSCVSVHAYLSQNFKGGFTTFLSEGRYLDVKLRTGSILLFQHDIMHEGQTVTQGTKYLLRSDVMYSTHSSCTTNDTVSGTAPTEQL